MGGPGSGTLSKAAKRAVLLRAALQARDSETEDERALKAVRATMFRLMEEMDAREALLPENMPPLPGFSPEPEPARLRTRVWQNSTSGRWHWAIWQPRPDLAKPENPKPIEKFGCGGYSSEEVAARALTYQREALVSRSRKESG